MPKLPSAGAPIKAEEAHSYIQKQVALKSKLNEHLAKTESTLDPDLKAHYHHDSNSFLFDVDKVKALLETADKNGELPQYLMVTLGANYHEGADLHKPTVVLAGVSYDDKKDNYYTMGLTNPGLQQPPPITNPGFPAPRG